MEYSSEKLIGFRMSFSEIKEDEIWGYGLLQIINEMLFAKSDSKLPLNNFNRICFQLKIEPKKFQTFFKICIAEGIFIKDDEWFWNEEIIKAKKLIEEKRQRKSRAGKKGMESRWKKNDIQ